MNRDDHNTWVQGAFIDHRMYCNMGDDWKADMRKDEALCVRSAPKGNVLCRCVNPDDAAWIAKRLNTAARLEQLLIDLHGGDIPVSYVADVAQTISDARDAMSEEEKEQQRAQELSESLEEAAWKFSKDAGVNPVRQELRSYVKSELKSDLVARLAEQGLKVVLDDEVKA